MSEIKKKGAENLMIMADFDQTISKYLYPRSLGLERAERLGIEDKSDLADASMKVMLECSKFTPQQKQEVKDLFTRYRPIEMDPTLPMSVKSKHMMDWWVGDFEIFAAKSLSLTENDFRNMVY